MALNGLIGAGMPLRNHSLTVRYKFTHILYNQPTTENHKRITEHEY